MKAKEIYLNLYDLHTVHLNETDPEVVLGGSVLHKGKSTEVIIVFNDLNFLEFISHDEINRIKENLKERIDNL
jgi:hypothetical protein